jgi:hypothetical protein
MHQQDPQARFERVFLLLAQRLDLLGEVRQVDPGQAALAKMCRLLHAPAVEIALVEPRYLALAHQRLRHGSL